MKTTDADADFAAVALSLRDFRRDAYQVIKRPIFLVLIVLINLYAVVFAVAIAVVTASIEPLMSTFLSVSLLLTTFWLIPWMWHVTYQVRFSDTLRMLSPKAFRSILIIFLLINIPIALMLTFEPLRDGPINQGPCDPYSVSGDACP